MTLVDKAMVLVDDAERHVRACEAALAAQVDPTMVDIAETELRAALALQDEIAERVAPAVERRRCEIRDQAHEAIRVAAGGLGDWTAPHRRWMAPAVTSFIIRRWGLGLYRRLPW